MPLYLKSHSQGEYIFDHAWADAYERAGGRYYPKLLSAAPFTPATGPRLLVRPDVDPEQGRKALLGGALTVCERYGASGLHVNFPTREEWTWLGEAGMALREGQQYHWVNRGYATFDDFLADLSSGRRKTIRRERRDAIQGLEIHCLTGAELTEAHWDAFYRFYVDTGSRKWGRPYLTRRYYSHVGEALADRILLVMSRRNGRYVAGAIHFIGDDALYDRNWRVEAGAQGEHKLMRGYEPVQTYSAHAFADPALQAAVADYLAAERRAVESGIVTAREALPFRRL